MILIHFESKSVKMTRHRQYVIEDTFHFEEHSDTITKIYMIVDTFREDKRTNQNRRQRDGRYFEGVSSNLSGKKKFMN